MARGPLEGVRVLDLTRVWAGPLAARILGDLGADVIRIEAATGRTAARVPRGGFGIFPDGEPGARPWNRSGPLNKLARNKRSVSLDLKTERGRELFLGLVARSDVVIENFSARVLESLRLDYPALAEANPRIVHVAMPGFGLTGPYRDRVAFGPTVEPLAGLLALLGYGPDEPRMTAIALPDAIAGVNGAAATLTALCRRDETGRGALVEVSQHEACIATFGEYAIERQLEGREPERPGNGHPRYAPHGTYRCAGADAWIAIACRDEAEWRALAGAAGAGWERDARFGDTGARRRNREALDAAIEAWTRTRSKLDLQRELQSAGVPAGAVLEAGELCADPHLEARGFFVELDYEDAGAHRYAGSPFAIDGERHADVSAGSALGADNAEVLRDLLGLDADEIAALHDRGVLADRPPGAPPD